MDLIKFHHVAALIGKQSGFIEMPNHIKQSFHFFPQTYGAQSFSTSNLLCQLFVFFSARYNTLSRRVQKPAVGVFVDFFVAAIHTVCLQ